jgi:carbon monoxide dehydrogenase subunit G
MNMPQHRLEITEKVNAPKDTVFERLADHNRMGEYMSADIRRTKNATVASEGPNGTGSVRTLKIFGMPDFDETVLEFRKPDTIKYKITRGSPLKNHLGVIVLSEEGGATRVDWTITFEMGFGGAVVAFLLKFAVGGGLSKLKKLIEVGA